MTRGDSCELRWCDERPDHGGNHRGYVHDLFGDVVNLGDALSLTLEAGPAETTPLPVLTIGNGRYHQFRMSWAQCEALGQWLLEAADRWEA